MRDNILCQSTVPYPVSSWKYCALRCSVTGTRIIVTFFLPDDIKFAIGGFVHRGIKQCAREKFPMFEKRAPQQFSSFDRAWEMGTGEMRRGNGDSHDCFL